MKINFASTRLAFVLIAILLLLLVLSALIPQRDIASGQLLNWQELLGDSYSIIETLGLDRIYFSPFFFIVLGLLGTNLVVGNVRRFHGVYKTERTLFRARHIGSIIFHLSLVLIMAGVILNYLYKSERVFGVTEGQTVPDRQEAYFRIFNGPLSPDDYGRFSLTLDSLRASPEHTDMDDAIADIQFFRSANAIPVSAELQTGRPFKWENLELHFGSKVGYSPEVVVVDSTGQRLFASFVRLSTRTVDGRSTFADFVLLPQQGLKVGVEVLTASDSARFEIIVESPDGSEYIDTLSLGQMTDFEGLRLTIPRLRKWCYINVVKSPFLDLVFAGFWLALSGLTIGFIPRLIRPGKRG